MLNSRTKLSREQFDAFGCYYPSNIVIVEMPPEHTIVTEAGLDIGFNPDVQYGSMDGTDTSAHIADCADIFGTVVKQVDRLYFNRKDINHSMSWECDVETLVGDIVFFHPLISKNCSEILVEDTVYKVIPYEDIFVARRGGLQGEVICLNGNILMETILKPKLSNLDVSDPQEDKFKGIVRYNGSNNRSYITKGQVDMTVNIGDTVILDKKSYPFYLERSKYNSNFDGDKQFIVIQKRYILAVV
jgi:hypothetical protein